MIRGDFKAWLEASEPYEVVGVRGSPFNCPLAKWTGCIVGLNKYSLGGVVVLLPAWAARFREAVDASIPPLTARRALEILAGIP